MPNCDLVSDLHLDFYSNACDMLNIMPTTSKTLVIAGDLCEARNFDKEWAEILSSKYDFIYYIFGNHEYYGLSFMIELNKSFNLPSNWKILQNECSDDFKGTTLWFPDDPKNILFEKQWSDFKFIRHLKESVYKEHKIAKQFLFSEPYRPVWITHHLPFYASVHPKYFGANSNRFFIGDLEKDLISNNRPLPKIILHGHTHECFDYNFHGIRVVANPFGYPFEGRNEIIPKFVEW